MNLSTGYCNFDDKTLENLQRKYMSYTACIKGGIKYRFCMTLSPFQRLEHIFHRVELTFHAVEPTFLPLERRTYRQKPQNISVIMM